MTAGRRLGQSGHHTYADRGRIDGAVRERDSKNPCSDPLYGVTGLHGTPRMLEIRMGPPSLGVPNDDEPSLD